jgi:hypothetical protein
MKPIGISIVNASNILSDDDIRPVVAALQLQISQHLAPRWNIDATLEFVPLGSNAPVGNWWLKVLDDTDFSNDSGYHNVWTDGTPYAKVFVNTARTIGQSRQVTRSLRC